MKSESGCENIAKLRGSIVHYSKPHRVQRRTLLRTRLHALLSSCHTSTGQAAARHCKMMIPEGVPHLHTSASAILRIHFHASWIVSQRQSAGGRIRRFAPALLPTCRAWVPISRPALSPVRPGHPIRFTAEQQQHGAHVSEEATVQR